MTTDNPYHLPWLDEDDKAHVKAFVEEMLRDPNSEYWTKCRDFVEKVVYKRAKNIPQSDWEDIIQEAMIKIRKSLSAFQYKCSLKTWLFGIVNNCIIDDHRRVTRNKQYITNTTDSYDSHEEGEYNDIVDIHLSRTAEEDFMIREETKQAIVALEEYIVTHGKRERNRQILNMFFYEDRSLKDAARAVGCSTAVAGYVVRSAQRYVRDKLGH